LEKGKVGKQKKEADPKINKYQNIKDKVNYEALNRYAIDRINLGITHL